MTFFLISIFIIEKRQIKNNEERIESYGRLEGWKMVGKHQGLLQCKPKDSEIKEEAIGPWRKPGSNPSCIWGPRESTVVVSRNLDAYQCLSFYDKIPETWLGDHNILAVASDPWFVHLQKGATGVSFTAAQQGQLKFLCITNLFTGSILRCFILNVRVGTGPYTMTTT